MSSLVVFRKGNFLVERSFNKDSSFWTVINEKPILENKKSRRNYHCHIDINNLTAAKMICIWAHKIAMGKTKEWPNHYPQHMQRGLRKVLTGEFESNIE